MTDDTVSMNIVLNFFNQVWCRLISFLKTYFTSTTYFWMFCEGWYLYRLLSKAFQQPESLRSLYLIGWGEYQRRICKAYMYSIRPGWVIWGKQNL